MAEISIIVLVYRSSETEQAEYSKVTRAMLFNEKLQGLGWKPRKTMKF